MSDDDKGDVATADAPAEAAPAGDAPAETTEQPAAPAEGEPAAAPADAPAEAGDTPAEPTAPAEDAPPEAKPDTDGDAPAEGGNGDAPSTTTVTPAEARCSQCGNVWKPAMFGGRLDCPRCN